MTGFMEMLDDIALRRDKIIAFISKGIYYIIAL